MIEPGAGKLPIRPAATLILLRDARRDPSCSCSVARSPRISSPAPTSFPAARSTTPTRTPRPGARRRACRTRRPAGGSAWPERLGLLGRRGTRVLRGGRHPARRGRGGRRSRPSAFAVSALSRRAERRRDRLSRVPERQDLFLPARAHRLLRALDHAADSLAALRHALLRRAARRPGRTARTTTGETVSHTWLRPPEALERARARGDRDRVGDATRDALSRLSPTGRRRRWRTRAPRDRRTTGLLGAGRDGKHLFRRDDAAVLRDPLERPAGDRRRRPTKCCRAFAKRLDALVTRVIAPNPGMMTGPGTNSYLVG